MARSQFVGLFSTMARLLNLVLLGFSGSLTEDGFLRSPGSLAGDGFLAHHGVARLGRLGFFRYMTGFLWSLAARGFIFIDGSLQNDGFLPPSGKLKSRGLTVGHFQLCHTILICNGQPFHRPPVVVEVYQKAFDRVAYSHVVAMPLTLFLMRGHITNAVLVIVIDVPVLTIRLYK